jgi:hypothetical protein
LSFPRKRESRIEISGFRIKCGMTIIHIIVYGLIGAFTSLEKASDCFVLEMAENRRPFRQKIFQPALCYSSGNIELAF